MKINNLAWSDPGPPRIGHRTSKKLTLLMLLAFVVSGCGGDKDNCSLFAEECPYTVKIKSFDVYGNDSPANGLEQIVAGINNGIFQLSLGLEPVDSGDSTIWVSDLEDLGSTNLEQKIAVYHCDYYPFCSFDVVLSCSFSVTNQVNCSVLSDGDGPIQANFPEADITPLLSGNQTDLFIVLVASANGAISALRSVPVTFRYN